MKKSTFMLLSLISINCFSQGGPKFSEDGNSLTSTSVLGSTNFMDLKIITNNQTRFIVGANGDLIMPMLSSAGSGLAVLDASGKAIKLNFTGNVNHVLRGDGTFGTSSSAAGWVTTGSLTTTNNKVGIGITAPIQALEVNGKAIFNGSVSAEEFLVGDVSSSGQNLRISTSICLDGYNASTGMRNELCVFTQPLYLNSKPGVNYHTIINDSNSGNVAIGTNNPTAKLHVNGNLKVDGESFYSGKSHFSRITGMPGDSIIRFGDSTINFNYTTNTIFGSLGAGSGGSAVNKGLGLGAPNAAGKGQNTVAIGLTSRAEADNSYTIGTRIKTTALGSIAFGSGIGTTFLENDKPSSLMIGFNSNLPTIFVSPATGLGTTGNVSIGTTCTTYKLTVEGEVGARGFWVKNTPWCDFVFKKDYKLSSYKALRAFIQDNGHLPNFPSQAEIEKNEGYSVGEMNKAFAQTIEEQSLYILDLNERLEFVTKKYEELEAKLNKYLNEKK